MSTMDKPVVWLHGVVKSPPFSRAARLEAGFLLRLLQQGELLGMPQSRPMPVIGARCHELRIVDEGMNWRIFYRLDTDAVVIADVVTKKTDTTPASALMRCRTRLRSYDHACRQA